MTLRARKAYPKAQPRWPKPNRDGFPAAVRKIITERSGGLCELDACGRAEVIHHRRPRGAGGSSLDWVNRAANGLHVSSACHDRIEGRHPQWSRTASASVGWLVSQHSSLTSAELPVLYRGVRVLLDDGGGVYAVKDGAA